MTNPTLIDIITAATKVGGVPPGELPQGRSYKATATRHIVLSLAMDIGLPREFLARWVGMKRKSLSPVRSLVAERLAVDREFATQYRSTRAALGLKT